MDEVCDLHVIMLMIVIIQTHSLYQPRVKRKRGDMTGTSASKHSAKRIEELFGEKETTVEYATKKGVVKSARPLRESEITHNNAWVSHLCLCW